ncbi:protein dispatched homolog 3 [Engraulis encrasicolus]|uniref:protein dispatched homolog 3 n=1 Tax=Engraulis encrasicolus TaxID=184585 RepID=UPI002FD6C55F
MEAEDEPLLLGATGDLGDDGMQDEDDEDGTDPDANPNTDPATTHILSPQQTLPGLQALWRAVGWVYTTPWASGAVLVLGFLLPFALSAYMFLRYPPLDIDLSYSAFEVRSHSSAQHFDALAVALKTQLGSWDRHRRNTDDFDSADVLRDLLLAKLNLLGGGGGGSGGGAAAPGGVKTLDAKQNETGVKGAAGGVKDLGAKQSRNETGSKGAAAGVKDTAAMNDTAEVTDFAEEKGTAASGTLQQPQNDTGSSQGNKGVAENSTLAKDDATTTMAGVGNTDAKDIDNKEGHGVGVSQDNTTRPKEEEEATKVIKDTGIPKEGGQAHGIDTGLGVDTDVTKEGEPVQDIDHGGAQDKVNSSGPVQGNTTSTGVSHNATASVGQDAGSRVLGGVTNRKRRSTGSTYSYLQSQALWRVELVFVAQGDNNKGRHGNSSCHSDGDRNIFTPERLRAIHRVERMLMEHPQFQRFCWKPVELLRDLPLGPSYCAPPSSVLSYLFPSERAGRIYFDGMGPDLADIRGALSLAITHPQFYWYVDESLTPDNLCSSLLRSEIHFGAPLPSFYSLQDRPQEQRKRFRDFVVQYADLLARQSNSQVKVLYGGTELFDDEVRRTFHSDMLLAVFSGACISILVYILTSFSVFLTFFGLASIGLSCLMALFLYHVVFGVRYLGILNGVAAFVIIGIGVDDVFVFISTFRQASHLQGQPLQRAVYTIKTAGRATFLTSFTTAAAYAANTFSQIPAVHDFGLFMALIVSCCWVWVSMLMPAALCVWSHCRAAQGNACLKWWSVISSLSVSHSPLSDEDDVALLSVEMEIDSLDVEADTALLSLSVEPLQGSTGKGGVGVVSTQLQRLLQRWVEPVVERRKLVIGVYVLVLLASAFCCCLLSPASHAPLLFRRDSNIQTLLNLRGNLSAQGISCPTCSGAFMERPHFLHSVGHHTPAGLRQTSAQQQPRTHSIAMNAATHGQNKPAASPTSQSGMITVYVSKLALGSAITLYRFSLNASIPSPWTPLTPGHGEVPSFQAYGSPHSNFSRRLTVCVSHAYRPHPHWMITSHSCDQHHSWTVEFSFYVATAQQQHSRRLYFAQHRLSPHPSRVCAEPPGCVISSGPDGPTQGSFYAPLKADPTPPVVSKTSGFNPCGGGVCGKPAVRPLVDTGAMVFVVFGILGVNRTQYLDNHVIGDMGSVIYDPSFDLFKEIGHLCQLCKAISANTKLVKPGGAQCLPAGSSLSSILPLMHPECHSLPEPNLLPGQLSHGAVGMQGGRIRWISMAFESTTYKGKSSFQTHADYMQWESFLQELLSSLPPTSSLHSGFQTCEHWKQIFMEIIGVQSALYSLLLSLVICIAAVSVFTAHLLLLLPILLSILGVVCTVVAIMYWLGWEMGAVEAISLSILVGSSVDYCLHLVEGYLLAGDTLTSPITSPLTSTSPGSPDPQDHSGRRTLEAVNHVGVAIVSSAVTTVISTLPLFFCVIVPFAKFGQIVAINTAVSILFTLVVTTALLAAMGPPRDFRRTPRAVAKACLAVLTAVGLGAVVFWVGGLMFPGGPWYTWFKV